MKILDRYVISEMLGPFLFGLSAFVLLFFAAETLMGVARLVMESRATMGVILEYLACRLPQVLVLTIPMSVLLSSLLAFGRLSGDSELTALKAGGVSLIRVGLPGLAFCAFITGVSMVLNEYGVPPAVKNAYNILLEVQEPDELHKALLTTPRTLENGQEMMVYAHTLLTQEKEIRGLFVHYFWEDKRFREIYADVARWTGTSWALKDMHVLEYDPNGLLVAESSSARGWTTLSPEASPPDPRQLAQRELRPEELMRPELEARLAALDKVRGEDENLNRRFNRYEVTYHQRLSLPFACLTFGAFGIPLGLRPHRTSTSIGLGMSLLFILLYYVLMSVGTILGEAGTFPTWAGAWMPNLVFGFLGLYLLVGASRR